MLKLNLSLLIALAQQNTHSKEKGQFLQIENKNQNTSLPGRWLWQRQTARIASEK